jgi:hypothetical protein
VALPYGDDHIVRLPQHQFLARAFMAGPEECLGCGAHVIVNTDADNQRCTDDIPRSIRPVLFASFAVMSGARPIGSIEHFSYFKKILQMIGSLIVRLASGIKFPDLQSGFRAISRKAAMSMNVFDNYTYRLETTIQTGQNGLAITYMPIRTDDCLRPSQILMSIPQYICHSAGTIIRMFIPYRLFRVLLRMPLQIIFVLRQNIEKIRGDRK